MRIVWVFLMLVLTASCGVDQNLVDELLGVQDIELLFPENNSECTEGTILSETQSEVVFRWSDAFPNENSAYQINLTNLISNNTDVINTDSTAMPVILERGIPYSWFITDAVSGSTRSAVWTFYNAGPGVNAFIPFPAAAVSPESESTIATSSSVNLVWNAIDLDEDITAYDVYFGQDEDPPLLQASLTDSFINNVPVSSGTLYYWKVTTKDAFGNESNSAVFNFQVE